MNYKVIWIILISIFITGCQNENKTWYDYGNGAINLENVNHITHKSEYIITLDGDSIDDLGKTYNGNLSDKQISDILNFITPESIAQQKFYKVHIRAYVLFDLFQLTLWESKDYLLKPSIYSVTDYFLDSIKENGATPEMLSALKNKLQGKIFNDKERFIDIVIKTAQFQRNDYIKNLIPKLGLGEHENKFSETLDENEKNSLLTPEEFERIKKGLNKARLDYLSIPIFSKK